MNSYSQIGQDMYVVHLTGGKTGGTFVDIGCAGPKDNNNTYLLEMQFGWSGLSIDLDSEISEPWEAERPNSTNIIADALKLDYSSIFKENNLPLNIDYLTLDLDPPSRTFEALKLLPLDEYTFNVVTYEHDGYRTSEDFKAETREYFKSYEYILLHELNNQDDVYVHKTHNLQEGNY